MKSCFTVTSEHGLHARPAAQIVKAVTGNAADIEIRFGDKTTSGESLFELLMLGITVGSQIEVTASGQGAHEIMDMIERLVHGHLDNHSDGLMNHAN